MGRVLAVTFDRVQDWILDNCLRYKKLLESI